MVQAVPRILYPASSSIQRINKTPGSSMCGCSKPFGCRNKLVVSVILALTFGKGVAVADLRLNTHVQLLSDQSLSCNIHGTV